MPAAIVEQDTVDEVARCGGDLIALCERVEPGQVPAGLRRAAIDLAVLLDELAADAEN